MIEISPCGRLSRIRWLCKTRGKRDIRKDSRAIIAQKGIRVPSRLQQPGPPQDQHIEVAIIVIIGLLHVQATSQARQTCLPGSLLKPPFPSVPEIAHRTSWVESRTHYIKQIVPVKIIHDHSTCQIEGIEIQAGGDVDESRPGFVGLKC